MMHKVFKITVKQDIWIEDHGGHHAIMGRNSINMDPEEIQTFADREHAAAALDGMIKTMTPDIVEGSLKDISEFDNHGKGK
jgi:hypothetical protein